MSEEELLDRAKRLAKESGRSVSDVLADLEDDGILNNSNNRGDLITQLQEAAELIDTVQAINRKVSENTVLNGGQNKTDVTVDTTLEGDVVDRAIASAHRKVVELKKIALIVAPVFLLISGGTLEGLGVINVFGSEDGEDYDEYTAEYGGCLEPTAVNYDPYASWDDGSCYWDDDPHNGGGGCGPDPQLYLSDWEIQSNENSSDAVVRIFLYDGNDCPQEWHGGLVVKINDEYGLYAEEQHDISWNTDYEDEVIFPNLDEGKYDVEVIWHWDGSHWHVNLEGQHEVV